MILLKRRNVCFRLPMRLFKVIEDIKPLFFDWNESNPVRGARTRALEYIIQYYMESEDYRERNKRSKAQLMSILEELAKREKEKITG